MAGIGNWCVGKGLADDGDLNAAAFEILNSLENRFFPFRICHITGKEGGVQFFD